MSRSFHVTRKSVEKARKIASRNSRRIFAEKCERLDEQYAAKRRVKEYARRHRHKTVVPLETDNIDTLVIEVADYSEYLHYPATEQDIHDLLKQMPQGLMVGLSKTTFCLGKHHQSMPEEPFYAKPDKDPYFDRIGYQIFDGVYQPRCLGAYFLKRREIKIHGYVYDPGVKDRFLLEFYLRLHMLCTFIHELAHHFDFTRRVAKGRWRMDNECKVEIYAESMAYQWIRDYVIPYIEKTYSTEYKKIQKWMKEKIGLILDLSLLIGDCRSTGKDDMIRFGALFNTSTSFEEFFQNIQAEKDVIYSRIELADDLHMAGEYNISLKILQSVLKEYPKNIDAMLVYADILNHQGEYEEAIRLSKKILRMNKDEVDALFHLCTSYENMGEWEEVLKLANQGRLLNSEWYLSFDVIKARAEVKLGKLREATKTLNEIKTCAVWKRVPLHIKRIESELRKKTGKQK